MNKHRFSVLDSYRGLFACLVAMSHFNAYNPFQNSHIFNRGGIWVDFFFVLSGFVIYANYSEKLRSGFGAAKFIFLRIGRLYPLHLAILLAYISVDLVQYVVHIDGAALYAPFSAPGEDISAIIANVFLVHSLGIVDELSFNGPSWSISVEFYTYILFAFVLIYSGRFYRHITFLVALISLVILCMNSTQLLEKLDFGFFRCVYGFGCGALVWEVFNVWHKKIGPIIGDYKIKSHVIELAAVVLGLVYVNYFAFSALSFFAPLVFGVFILLFSFEAGIVSKFLKQRFFLLLGTLSYSIYMVHMFVGGYAFALPTRLLEGKLGWNLTTQVDGISLFGTGIISGTAVELFYLALVVCCSFVSYKIIEEPFRKWSKQYVKNLENKPQP